ncbi:MAG: hypothetical protein K0U41_06320 [Gammaproteobacteria bacterium]|nr:hypothetical protein [Gammaproteobacteria bacterium]
MDNFKRAIDVLDIMLTVQPKFNMHIHQFFSFKWGTKWSMGYQVGDYAGSAGHTDSLTPELILAGQFKEFSSVDKRKPRSKDPERCQYFAEILYKLIEKVGDLSLEYDPETKIWTIDTKICKASYDSMESMFYNFIQPIEKRLPYRLIKRFDEEDPLGHNFNYDI